MSTPPPEEQGKRVLLEASAQIEDCVSSGVIEAGCVIPLSEEEANAASTITHILVTLKKSENETAAAPSSSSDEKEYALVLFEMDGRGFCCVARGTQQEVMQKNSSKQVQEGGESFKDFYDTLMSLVMNESPGGHEGFGDALAAQLAGLATADGE